jgi:hypothetical protein
MKKLAAPLILLLAILACSIPSQHPMENQSGLDVSSPT